MEKNEKPKASASQRGDEALQQIGRELHAELFPEEYDHMYDSASKAKDRQRGKNPMNAEYVEKTNTQRAQLGFRAFNVGPDASNADTYTWVMEKLRQGEEAELREMMADRAREALEIERRREQARQQIQTPAWFDQKIDSMLQSDKFLSLRDPEKTGPHVIAFRIMGELFTINPHETCTTEFFRQISRLLPGRSETEYHALYQHALDKWTEPYGY